VERSVPNCRSPANRLAAATGKRECHRLDWRLEPVNGPSIGRPSNGSYSSGMSVCARQLHMSSALRNSHWPTAIVSSNGDSGSSSSGRPVCWRRRDLRATGRRRRQVWLRAQQVSPSSRRPLAELAAEEQTSVTPQRQLHPVPSNSLCSTTKQEREREREAREQMESWHPVC